MSPLKQFDAKMKMSRETFLNECKNLGTDRKTALALFSEIDNTETWKNDTYIVTVNRNVINSFSGTHQMYCLKVSNQESSSDIPWADAVLIKNQLIGKDCAMVELYPTEEQLADGVNHHQFYGFTDSSVRFPFGVIDSINDKGGVSDESTPGPNDKLH